MRKIVSLSIIFISFFFFLSCKKGEDDPAFTLLTRKQRVAGDWKLQEGSITIGIKDSNGSTASLIYKLNETTYTLDEVGKGAHFEDQFKLNISFTKAGAVTIKQVMDSISFEATGTWDFEGNVGKSNNKERMDIQLEEINTSSDLFRLFNKTETNFNYRIKELRNKKMVLVSEEEMILLNKSYGVFVTSEYILVQ